MKKLFHAEVTMIVLAIVLFLIIFSVQSGWRLDGVERCNVATLAAIVVCVLAVIVFAGGGTSIVATIASIIATVIGAVILFITVTINNKFVGIVFFFAIAIAFATVTILVGNKKIRKFSYIISLLLTGLLTAGSILLITFIL